MHTQEEFDIRMEEGMRLMINRSSLFDAFVFDGTGACKYRHK
jgi:hypothetical protein